MYFLPFLLLEVISFAQDNTSICIQEMQSLQSLPLNQQLQQVLPYYSISGDWIYKFGYYDKCLREDKAYSSVQIDQTMFKLYYGFCHSNICSADDFNSKDGQQIIKDILNISGIAYLLQLDEFNNHNFNILQSFNILSSSWIRNISYNIKCISVYTSAILIIQLVKN